MCPESAELLTTPPERLADLLMLSYEPMFAWKLHGAIEFWNTGAERLYGFASNEAVGRSSHRLLKTKFPIELAELHSQLRNEHYWAGELRHICKDGREVIVDSRMQLLGDNTVLEVNRDVTEIRSLLTALQEGEQRLRSLAAIVESSDDAIISKNLGGIITSWNTGAQRVFGYTAAEAVGQPVTIVIPADRQSEEREILTRIRRGERIDHFETIRHRKDGTLIVVSLTVSPVRNAEGQIIGASKIARDITEQKRSQEQIATLAREATVGQLSSSIAHEIRQPLAGIMANAQAALRWLEKANVEEVREGLNGIVSDGHRAADIITNLRAMFKSDVQEKTLVDINKLVSSVLALARIDLHKHKTELQAQLDDRIPEVLGNQVQLQQVILNLVTNAIEAMSSSQTRVLRIKTELNQSNKVHVSIEDTGTGIKPSDVARLFKSMFTTKARGMGMGLSICQSVIENHDGRIWVSPRANGGSIFQFELPTIADKD